MTSVNCAGIVPKLAGSFWPDSLLSTGLGSNVSIWLGPPAIIRKMTALGFGRKMLRLGGQRIDDARVVVLRRPAASRRGHPARASRAMPKRPSHSPPGEIQCRRVIIRRVNCMASSERRATQMVACCFLRHVVNSFVLNSARHNSAPPTLRAFARLRRASAMNSTTCSRSFVR